jgi:exportin-1
VCIGNMQVFKITLEYWNFFVPDIYSSVSTLDVNAPFAFGGPVAPSNRKALYAAVLSRLRLLMISRMAKPEEVGMQTLLALGAMLLLVRVSTQLAQVSSL